MIEQMRDLPALDARSLAEPSIQVSLLIPARHSGHALAQTCEEAYRYLSARYPGNFEIILIPNSPAPGSDDRSLAIAESLAAKHPEVRVVPHDSPVGKGAALRSGFQASRGRWVFFTDADLPYDLGFFDVAARKLRGGYSLVTGNRRFDTSHFNVPVSLLPLAYGRHRLGLLFNRVVRWLLPIRTIDTQAGIKAMTRELAEAAFVRQRCPGFFFDLEIFLSARGMNLACCEVPVTLFLNSEKSTVRILRESILAAFWLTRIAYRLRRGEYGKPAKARPIPRRYPAESLGTRFFLQARWKLTPYGTMASRLPEDGAILDLGCGHGLLSLTAALQAPSRTVLGIDHDETRISLAREAARDVPNLKFASGNMTSPLQNVGEGKFSGIAMIDVLHYFEPAGQEALVRQAFDRLESGGRLLVREVDPDAGWISAWNRLYEKIATATGFTRSEKKTDLSFRTPEGWTEMLRRAGFRVRSEPCSSALFADVLFVCERPSTAPRGSA